MQELKIPAEQLSVSVYRDDLESYEIWEKHIRLPQSKIYRYGEKDNFGLRMRRHMARTAPAGHAQKYFSTREKKLVMDEKNVNLPVIATDLWKYGIWCLPSTTAKKEASWNRYHTKMLIQAWDWKGWHVSCKEYKPTSTSTSSVLLSNT